MKAGACDPCRRLHTRCDDGQPCFACQVRDQSDGCKRSKEEIEVFRHTHSNACRRCRKIKRSCDHGEPCKTCMKVGKRHECIYDMDTKQAIRQIPTLSNVRAPIISRSCRNCSIKKRKCNRTLPCMACCFAGTTETCYIEFDNGTKSEQVASDSVLAEEGASNLLERIHRIFYGQNADEKLSQDDVDLISWISKACLALDGQNGIWYAIPSDGKIISHFLSQLAGPHPRKDLAERAYTVSVLSACTVCLSKGHQLRQTKIGRVLLTKTVGEKLSTMSLAELPFKAFADPRIKSLTFGMIVIFRMAIGDFRQSTLQLQEQAIFSAHSSLLLNANEERDVCSLICLEYTTQWLELCCDLQISTSSSTEERIGELKTSFNNVIDKFCWFDRIRWKCQLEYAIWISFANRFLAQNAINRTSQAATGLVKHIIDAYIKMSWEIQQLGNVTAVKSQGRLHFLEQIAKDTCLFCVFFISQSMAKAGELNDSFHSLGSDTCKLIIMDMPAHIDLMKRPEIFPNFQYLIVPVMEVVSEFVISTIEQHVKIPLGSDKLLQNSLMPQSTKWYINNFRQIYTYCNENGCVGNHTLRAASMLLPMVPQKSPTLHESTETKRLAAAWIGRKSRQTSSSIFTIRHQ